MLLQMFSGQIEMVPAHSIYVVGFALTYVMISWIRKASDPEYTWPYPFMNTWSVTTLPPLLPLLLPSPLYPISLHTD